MALFPVLLKRRYRKKRQALRIELERMLLYLDVGYDLSYAWESVRQKPLSQDLNHLIEHPIHFSYLNWFIFLIDIYQTGAPVRPSLLALCEQLKRDEAIELEQHLETLPSRLNLVLLLFFLPATFLILFAPLLFALTSQLQ